MLVHLATITAHAGPPQRQCSQHYDCPKHDAAWGREVVAACQRGCDGTSADNCDALAVIYALGSCGVSRDEKKAGTLVERGCAITEKGSENCTYAGDFFRAAKNGPGVVASSPDYVRARNAYEHGCQTADNASCMMLGRMLRDGIGGPVDGVRAVQLLSKACNERYPEQSEACLDAAKMYETGAAGIPKNLKEARAHRSYFKKIRSNIP